MGKVPVLPHDRKISKHSIRKKPFWYPCITRKVNLLVYHVFEICIALYLLPPYLENKLEIVSSDNAVFNFLLKSRPPSAIVPGHATKTSTILVHAFLVGIVFCLLRSPKHNMITISFPKNFLCPKK